MPRVALIQNKEDIAPEHYALFDELAALRGRISGPSTIVLHSPGLARPWNEISEYLHRDSVVEPEHAELAVSATAREKDCGYIWNAHVPAARRAGVSDATIVAVRERQPLDGLPAEEAAVVHYVRQLMQTNRVEGDLVDQLLHAHGPRWLVELTVWIGRYAALAGVLNGFELRPDHPVEVLPVEGSPTDGITRSPARAPLSTPRLPPVTSRDQVAEADRALFDTLAARPETVPGQAILLHSPPLCQRIADVETWLHAESAIAPELRELAVLATAREKDCPYLWATHAPRARQAGVSETVLAAVRARAPLEAIPPTARDTVAYVRQQLQAHHVTQDLFDRLRDRHGIRWLVELTCLLGHHGLVASVLNAVECAPGAAADPLE